jgi:hypothetical protein
MRLHARRQCAEIVQHPLAEPIRVAQAVLCQYDSLGDGFVSEISSVGVFEARACHLECGVHDTLSLGIEFEIVQIYGDGHNALSAITGGSARISQPPTPDEIPSRWTGRGR